MKIKFCLFLLGLILISNQIKCQESNLRDSIYHHTYDYINSMLAGEIPLSFKEAVMRTEDAYFNGKMNPDLINEKYKLLVKMVNEIANSELITYSGKDKDNIIKHAAIFKVLTDTIYIPVDSTHYYIHTPYTYDFEDPLGLKDWTKMFVTKLLETGKGNCHSLPYLYKILADEFNIPCNLAFAPNHIYIKLMSENKGWYNTELTSATFPIDAWIIASGYVTIDAIRNGVYMDTLSNKQAVANCLIDLAQAYRVTHPDENPGFVVKCCNTVLEHHPTNVNAMLTKAEAQKQYIHMLMKRKRAKKPDILFDDDKIKEMYSDMETTYVNIHKLGYRQMPVEMYSQWLNLLRTEPEKFTNE